MIIGVERTNTIETAHQLFLIWSHIWKERSQHLPPSQNLQKKLSHTSPIWDCPWNGNWFQKIRPISLWKGSFLDLLIRKIFQHICSGAADFHIFLLLRTLPWTDRKSQLKMAPWRKNQWIWRKDVSQIVAVQLAEGRQVSEKVPYKVVVSPVMNCWKLSPWILVRSITNKNHILWVIGVIKARTNGSRHRTGAPSNVWPSDSPKSQDLGTQRRRQGTVPRPAPSARDTSLCRRRRSWRRPGWAGTPCTWLGRWTMEEKVRGENSPSCHLILWGCLGETMWNSSEKWRSFCQKDGRLYTDDIQ